jgi:hypothetical protein
LSHSCHPLPDSVPWAGSTARVPPAPLSIPGPTPPSRSVPQGYLASGKKVVYDEIALFAMLGVQGEEYQQVGRGGLQSLVSIKNLRDIVEVSCVLCPRSLVTEKRCEASWSALQLNISKSDLRDTFFKAR